MSDTDADYVDPCDLLAELREGSKTLAMRLRQAYTVCDERGDISTASLLRFGSTRRSSAPGTSSKRGVSNSEQSNQVADG